MKIRAERPEDLAQIREVLRASFPSPAEASLVDALRDAGRLRISLVAVERDRVVGHVAFSPITLAGTTGGLGLAPVAVAPAYRRRRIADQLIREGLALCERSECGFAVVLGDPAYYGRFGFESASGWGLGDEYGGGDAFQALEIRPGSIPQGAGLVRYAPEFAAAVDDPE